MSNALPVKVFSHRPKALIEQPNLTEIQTNSYKWFLEKGLRELFEEISPIRDYTGELELSFLEYYFDEPKYTEEESKAHSASYEATLRVRAQLKNTKSGEIKDQEVYLGEFPLMSSRGTFIINGVERVIVPQIIRSSGVFFIANTLRGRNLYGAKIIPNRGAWLELETDSEGVMYVKIDRKRKIPVTSLLRIFGLPSEEDIKRAFAA